MKTLLILIVFLKFTPCFSLNQENRLPEDPSLFEPFDPCPALTVNCTLQDPATGIDFFLCNGDKMKSLMELLLPDEAILDFSFHDTILQISVITHDVIRINNHYHAENMLNSASRFIRSIKRIDNNEFYREGRVLYNLLFSSVIDHIQEKSRLIIIAAEKIAEVPFEALIIDDTGQKPAEQKGCDIPFLICRYEVLYSPSLSYWYNACRYHDKTADVKSFLGIAPVLFQDDNGDRFSRLPYSENEVLVIEDLFRSRQHNALSCLYDDATANRLSCEIPGKTYVHIATHTTFNEEEPDRSGLVLSDAFNRKKENITEIMHDEDILRLRVDAHLVVLSACSSGKMFGAGTGSVKSLSRSFMRAGARNVVYSLWNVTDKYGSEFMKGFYKKILEGKQYSTSLRETKLDFIADRETSLPYLWAGFILEGE